MELPSSSSQTTYVPRCAWQRSWIWALSTSLRTTVLLSARMDLPISRLSTWPHCVQCLSARQQLAAHGIRTRVVSMPSWELFDEQPVDYLAAVLGPVGVPRLAVEAGV